MRYRLLLAGVGVSFIAFSTALLAMPPGHVLSWRSDAALREMGSRLGYASRLSSLAMGKTKTSLSVLETDVWTDGISEGPATPIARFPITRTPLRQLFESLGLMKPGLWLQPSDFTPEIYLREIADTQRSYSANRDVILYFGGLKAKKDHHGLNLNAWTVEDLRTLRSMGCRPFIGLETWDAKAIRTMISKLHQAGYTRQEPIYVRVLSEPNTAAYGSELGKPGSLRDTPVAHAAYKKRFGLARSALLKWGDASHLRFKLVFAGFDRADLFRYMPPTDQFDAIGFDLYVTPENQTKTDRLLKDLSQRHPFMPLVIPEFGIATAGPILSDQQPWGRDANPAWGLNALGDVLKQLQKHPAGVDVISVFSVNVASRMQARRWSWAWSPEMFAALSDWARSNRWSDDQITRYDPRRYPIGMPVLHIRRPTTRILLERRDGGASPTFIETRYELRGGRWVRDSAKTLVVTSYL